jgi:hypothetical protein
VEHALEGIFQITQADEFRVGPLGGFGQRTPNQGGLGDAEEVCRLSLGVGSERSGWIDQQTRASGQEVLRARVLLKADADGPCWRDVEIARAFDCRIKTVENIRERFVTDRFEIALNGKPKSRVRGKVLSGDQEAKIIALRLGPPPKGFANWTLR